MVEGNDWRSVEADKGRIVAEVHVAWRAAGKLHDPPDETSHDDDLGFWDEVERRGREAGLVNVVDDVPCEVCGRASVTLRQSRLPLPTSCTYCARCDKEGLEPARVVEAFIADRFEGVRIDEWLELSPAQIARCDEIVRRSLAFYARRPTA